MDQQFLFLINRTWVHPVLDRIMAAASNFDAWWPFLLVAALALVIWGDFRMRAMVLAIGLAISVNDGLVMNTLKHHVGRPRPHDAMAGVRTLDLAKAKPRVLALGRPLVVEISPERILSEGGNSFPSAHSSNNFAVAAVCFAFYRRRGWLMFFPALLVAYSRIYVGAHWPLDVLVSCLIGAGIGFLTAAALEAAWKYWGGQVFVRKYQVQPSLLSA
jgi:undecaprenyl-diphosphatase